MQCKYRVKDIMLALSLNIIVVEFIQRTCLLDVSSKLLRSSMFSNEEEAFKL